MGVVFRATQLALERPVALKAIAPELAADDEYRERFQTESHLTAIIDHPNVIPVYEAGEFDDTLYLIMRWIDGTDLRQLFKSSPRVSPRRAIKLLRPVASALAAAHRHGLVHRDVKPANVLIARSYEDDDEDHIYLTDFGIARRSDGKSLTGTGKFVGTIDYMAPERIEGKKGDASCDTYSLGCVLFEALTGHVPFNRPTDISKMFAHVNDPVPSARAEVDGVPELLDEIITKSMAKRPEDRFGSAGEMTAALGRALLELDTGERTIVSAPQATVRSPAATAEPTELPEPTAAASADRGGVRADRGHARAGPDRGPAPRAKIATLPDPLGAADRRARGGGGSARGRAQRWQQRRRCPGPDPRERPDGRTDDHAAGGAGSDVRGHAEPLGVATRAERDRPVKPRHCGSRDLPGCG